MHTYACINVHSHFFCNACFFGVYPLTLHKHKHPYFTQAETRTLNLVHEIEKQTIISRIALVLTTSVYAFFIFIIIYMYRYMYVYISCLLIQSDIDCTF